MKTNQNKDKLAVACQLMSVITQIFIIGMLLLNVAAWVFQPLFHNGIVLSLTADFIQYLKVDVYALPWWQTAGAIILSSLPLLALAFGLHSLASLFRIYSTRAYYSTDAAICLGKTGKMLMLWVILSFLCEPLLSVWITMNEPIGHRVVSVSLTTGYFVALFLAGCIWIIAHILKKASYIHSEINMFV